MSEKAWHVHAAKHLTERSVNMSVTCLVKNKKKKRKAREHLEERRESKKSLPPPVGVMAPTRVLEML